MTVNVSINSDDLIVLARSDYDTFASLLIPDRLIQSIDSYHRRVFWRMVSDEIPKYACALPRGHIKTTLLKLAFVYMLVYGKQTFPLFLAGSHNLAESGCSDIMDILQSENFAKVYGAVKLETHRTSTADYAFTLNKIKISEAGTVIRTPTACLLRGRSSGQKVRGMSKRMMRPDVVGMDDIDQDDDIKSEIGYEGLKSWVYGPVLKIGYKDTRFIHIGNYIAQKCVIGDHIADEGWTSDHFSALKPDGAPLWPGYWTREELIADFRAYQRQGRANEWFAEMLNNPLENATGMIGYRDIRFLPSLIPLTGNYSIVFLTVDPAISTKLSANRTAIAVHAFNVERDCWQLAEIVYEQGYDPIKLFVALLALSDKWGISFWAIEAVAYQASLLPLYKTFLANAQRDNIKVVAAPGSNRSKLNRITAWFGLLKSGSYALTEGQLGIVQRILAFKPQDDDNADDDIDAAAYFVNTFTLFGEQIAGPAAHVSLYNSQMIDIDHFCPR